MPEATLPLVLTCTGFRLESQAENRPSKRGKSNFKQQKLKGTTHITPFAVCFGAPVEITLKHRFKVAATRPHQAHPNQMARATANVSGNNQIVSGLENPPSGARKQIQ